MAIPPAPHRLPLAALALLLLYAPLGAQTVRGQVRVRGDASPLPGALVLLADSAGTEVRAVLTDDAGTFVLSAPAPGHYRVRAEVVGHATAEAVTQVTSEGAEVELFVVRTPPEVGGGSVKADGACRIPADDAERINGLWAEASKALRALRWAESTGALRLQSETWYRSLEPRRLRVLEEARTPRPGFHATARIPSPPAETLVREGFVQGGGPGESVAFHGPDPAVLLDPVFARTHCLGFDAEGPEHGWVGLTFAPLDTDAREVAGTLWIDGATGAPRRLEYRYTALPWPVKTDKAGGGMDFEQLAQGPWIVRRWWLRMPRVGVREERITQWAAPQRRYVLSGLMEEGGEVTHVRLSDGTVSALDPPVS